MASDDALAVWMRQANISSYRQLARQAGVSSWQVSQLRQGKVATMRVESLLKLCSVLKISLPVLISECVESQVKSAYSSCLQQWSDGSDQPAIASLEQDYTQLKRQVEEQRQTLQLLFETASLDCLESWLRQWSRVVYLVHQNPQTPAKNILSVLNPIHQLLSQWGVKVLGAVGQTVCYDPQIHVLLDGVAKAGDRVRVHRSGYRHRDRLLFRADVILEP